MRPRGEISQALHAAAAQQPGTVRELAERARVGYGAAAYTASRMLDRGELVVLDAGRPARLVAAEAALPAARSAAPPREAMAGASQALQALHARFWRRPGAAPAGGTASPGGADVALVCFSEL